MALSTGTRLGTYEILGLLGAGGMGEVYRAKDTRLGREVAIKVLPAAVASDPERLARFEREARTLASLNHPNIAAIYGVEDHALIMELVEGPTLAERIAKEPIPLAEAMSIVKQIAEALEYAHEKGIIHRDLKPANVKLTGPSSANPGQAKVLDFGLAKAMASEAISGSPTSSPTLTMRGTMAGVIMGTAAYMSPEQARGGVADRRADVWSFGVLFYEMLTGRQMFTGDTVSDTLAAVLRADPDWSTLPAETPPAIRRLLRRCLERDRKKRLRDIGDAFLELDEAPMSPQAPVAPPQTRAGFHWWNAAVSLLALAGLVVAVLHFRETPPEPVPMRFQIPVPEKANFGNSGIALSPDGRRLVFIAAGAGGQPMLWVRSLNSLTAQALPGTEGAAFLPFWSPDSHFIGFGVGGTLKKVEASGGPPQILSQVPGGAITGGSWNREGVIVFGPPTGGLFRVHQAGGVATKLTTPNESRGELGHLRPWFLPDGRHFLYATRNRQQQDFAIYLATLDGTEPKRLVGSPQAGAYAPPVPGSGNGHLLFLRDGTLMAQPMDTRSFELAGEPFPIAEQVGSYLSMGLFSVSANGSLAYRSGGAVFGSQLVWFDREGKSVKALGPPGSYGGLALAPDGKGVAVDELDQAGGRDVWVLDIARGVPTRFTFGAVLDRNPVWSPDGMRLAFSSNRTGENGIYQKDFSGSGNEQPLLKAGVPTDWSSDGRTLLYSLFDSKTASDLWVLPDPAAAGEHKPALYLQTPFTERQGQFSPDGRWIAYTSNESGQDQIQVQSFPAGSGKFQVSTGAGGTQPRWRRDGKEIFYIATDGKLMAVEVKTAPKFEPGAPKALFDPRIVTAAGAANDFRYAVAADGKLFVVNSVANSTESSVPAPITVVINWQAAMKR